MLGGGGERCIFLTEISGGAAGSGWWGRLLAKSGRSRWLPVQVLVKVETEFVFGNNNSFVQQNFSLCYIPVAP